MMNAGISKLRVAIITYPFPCFGGIQTCFIELVNGLNKIGIIPDILWDEPMNWDALGQPSCQASYAKRELLISSKRMRSLPRGLQNRLTPIRNRFSTFGISQYDFVYCFEPGVVLQEKIPNLFYTVGPPYVRIPSDDKKYEGFLSKLSQMTKPAYSVDRRANFVTISQWIAELFQKQYHFQPPVIWPPARERRLEPQRTPHKRQGFLFLSRLKPYKRPDLFAKLAELLPQESFTIAGARSAQDPHLRCVRVLIERSQAGADNIRLVVNPSEQEVAQLLQTHKYFIFPAKWEHFGIVTVEAIQAGLLPIVHNSGGQVEIVPIEGLRFDDDKDLSEKVSNILAMDEDERADMIQSLQWHVARSLPVNYCREMLKPLFNLI